MLFAKSAIILLLTFIPSILASAASQFSLSTVTDVSDCWIACHNKVTVTILMPGAEDGNGPDYITKNCQLDEYPQYMALCLPQLCISAPDVAYAYEYGIKFCDRAGVKISLQLPATYLSSDAGAYFNATQLATSNAGRSLSSASTAMILLGVGSVALLGL